MDDTDDVMDWYELGRDAAALGYDDTPPAGASDEQDEAYRAGWSAGWRGGCVVPPDVDDV